MLKKNIAGRSVKYYLAIVIVPIWFSILLYALVKNPSATDAIHRLAAMKADMAATLANGGAIIYRHENAKYGGALLFVLIRKDSWSEQARYGSIETLANLGWKLRKISSTSFCKQGALARIQENAGDYKDAPTILISMEYNSATIKTCG